jgi:hypothetical protein
VGGWRWHGGGVRGEVAWGRGEEDQDEEEDQPETRPCTFPFSLYMYIEREREVMFLVSQPASQMRAASGLPAF